MAKETITEYKTEEYQITKTLCDNCGRTEEEAQILPVAINPKEKKNEWNELELIETFDDVTEARKELREWKRNEVGNMLHAGIGMRTHSRTTDMNASAEADVCASCIFTLFGIEIPEGEEVEEIEIKEGELNIDTTKEVRSIWPQINIPKWANPNDKVMTRSWVSHILMWPSVLLFSFFDLLFLNFTNEERKERVKGYIGGSFGTILWIIILLWFVSPLFPF